MDLIYERLDTLNEDVDFSAEPSEIQHFFAGQTVFFTGCTGFLGKLFVEKLLRSCPDIQMLYVLVRPKGSSTDERMKKYFNNPIFDRLKSELPDFRSKVSTIEGDLTVENLGLSAEDRARLVNETTLIYHNASNVKFDVKLSSAIRINVFGAKYMLDLARECKNVIGFVYISTAYAHSYQQHIEEKFYSPPGDINFVTNLLTADEATPEGLDQETVKNSIGKWPNVYTFTKSVAENLVEEYAKESTFACMVFRPSMVLSTFMEPIRGWCGNINGPVGLTIANCLGFVHKLYKSDTPVDYIPGDMCANAMIATTWDAVVNKKTEKEAIIYNYGSSTVNPISPKKFAELCFIRGITMPSVYTVAPYYITYTNSVLIYWFFHLTVHLATALMADLVLLSQNKKTQAFGYWMLLTKNVNMVNHFSNGNWRIQVHRMQTVWKRMNRRDSKLFFCDLNKFDWGEYAYAYWPGLRIYIVKDPASTREAAVKKNKMLNLGHAFVTYVLRTTVLFFLGRWLLRFFQFY